MQFPNVLSKGCLFHFGQSLLKRLGLKTSYGENEGFNLWIKHIFSKALVPKEHIDELLEKILETKPSLPGFDAFAKLIIQNFN